jgi:hypothetical protein
MTKYVPFRRTLQNLSANKIRFLFQPKVTVHSLFISDIKENS